MDLQNCKTRKRNKMPKSKDPKKKLKVKARALNRGPEKNDQDFEEILKKLAIQRELPLPERDTDELIICRVENMEGAGNFHLWSKEDREYYGGCPGNLVLENMVGQLVKFRIYDIPSQPLVLVLLINGKTVKKPEIVAILSDEDPVIKAQRLDRLEKLGIVFRLQEDKYEFEKGEDHDSDSVEMEDL
jgi:hypothetical protein